MPINWVVADAVYGHGTTLRNWLERQDRPYALAVPATETVCVWTPHRCLLKDVAGIAATARRILPLKGS
jgi:SRSO17 transposase